MAELTLEQQRALALSRARQRRAAAEAQSRAAGETRTQRMTFLPMEVTTSADADGDGSREWNWEWAVPGAVKEAYEGFTGAVTAPGRAMSGELQVMGPDGNVSQEAIREGFNFAGAFSPSSVAGRYGTPDIKTLAKGVNTTPAALREIAGKAAQDGLNEQSMARGLADLGPEGTFADLGPNLTGLAGGIANTPGRGQKIIRETLEGRNAGANARIRSSIDDTLGPNAVPSQIERQIKEQYLDVDPLYDEALRGAGSTDVDGVAKFLDQQVPVVRGDAQRALIKTRGMLNQYGTESLDTNPATLLETRKAIDGLLAGENDTNVRGRLTEIRAQIDNALSDAAPGIKKADGRFQELKRQEEALQRGRSVLDSGKTAPTPIDVQNEFEAAALPAGKFMGPSRAALRMREGARAEIDRILGTNSNDVRKLHNFLKEDGDWNREKLATLFGSEKANQLFKVLDSELTFANNRNDILFNSKTMARQEAMRDLRGGGGLGLKDVYEAGGFPGLGRRAVSGALDKATKAWSQRSQAEKEAAIAEAIMTGRTDLIGAIGGAQRAKPSRIPLEDMFYRTILLGQTGQ